MISGAISPVPAPAASISHLSQRRGLHLSLNYSSGGFSKPWLASGAQNSVFFSARANGYTSKVFAAPQPPNPKKEDKLVTEGLITELLPNCMFRVRLENGEIILGYVSGKMRTKMVRVLVGDRVRIEVSRYDSTRGRIVYRLRSKNTTE